MKVCKLLTGRIIETQFGNDAYVLLKNGQVSHPNQEIEVVDITIEEYNIAIKIQNENDKTYAQKRTSEYPDFKEYLDGIVKNDNIQIQKYINDCLAIKVKYPKI